MFGGCTKCGVRKRVCCWPSWMEQVTLTRFGWTGRRRCYVSRNVAKFADLGRFDQPESSNESSARCLKEHCKAKSQVG